MTKTVENRNHAAGNNMGRNTARVYNANNEKMTLKERFVNYMHEVTNFYGEIGAKTGYRNPFAL
jgi:hypothetical protein